MKVQIVTHYPNDDKDCGGDYYDVEVVIDGKVAATYGDYYHDKGRERAEAFVQGVGFIVGTNLDAEWIDIADRDP